MSIRIKVFYILFFYVLSVSAQDFNNHWIAHPAADSVSGIWFRQTYITKKRPINAQIAITTTGYCDLYVNEFNVNTDFLGPYRKDKTNNPINLTYNITRFLRPDSNTIAVLYTPTHSDIERHQICITYYGTDSQGKNFAHFSDENWLCHLADHSFYKDGTESQNGDFYSLNWKSNSFDPACWLPAVLVPNSKESNAVNYASFYPSIKTDKVILPKYFDLKGDSVYYEFDKGFYGTFRVTLRGCKKGEKIIVDDFEYTCNGMIDEQISQRLPKFHGNRVVIYGDEKFKREQIQRIEAIRITPYFHTSFLY